MAEEKTQGAAVAPKKSRRGISNATRGTQRLKFSHLDAQSNGLFVGHIENVEVRDILIGEDTTGMPSFNGMHIPQLVITVASNETAEDSRKYVNLSFTAVESNAETTINGKKSWQVDRIFDYLKHLLKVFVLNGREMTEEEEIALQLPFEDFDDNDQYVPVDPEVVAAGWKTLFTNFAGMMNGADGTATYKTKEGKILPIWFKLLRYVKNGKKAWAPINNGQLTFPSFVGEGIFEVVKKNVAPNLRIDTAREAIIPMKIEEPAKAPNLTGAPAVPGGITIPMGGADMSAGLGMEAGDAMPF